jgi:hypothetical protein
MDKDEDRKLSKLERIFDCSICCESFNQVRCPMVFPCGHSVCIYCLTSLTSERYTVTCPTDKLTFSILECSKNFTFSEALDAVEQLIDKLNTIKLDDSLVKGKIQALKHNFRQRDLQLAVDVANKPVKQVREEVDSSWEFEDDSFDYDEEHSELVGHYDSMDSGYSEYSEEAKSVELCAHYQKFRTCRFGDSCKYAHALSSAEDTYAVHRPKYPHKQCFRMMREGVCYFGTKCWYSHVMAESPEDTGGNWDDCW